MCSITISAIIDKYILKNLYAKKEKEVKSDKKWGVSCIGMPHGTALWQIGESSEQISH